MSEHEPKPWVGACGGCGTSKVMTTQGPRCPVCDNVPPEWLVPEMDGARNPLPLAHKSPKPFGDKYLDDVHELWKKYALLAGMEGAEGGTEIPYQDIRDVGLLLDELTRLRAPTTPPTGEGET